MEGCSILVPGEEYLSGYLGGSPVSYYECRLTNEIVKVVQVGYPSDTSEIELERLKILRTYHTPKGELQPLTLICLRVPYFWEKRIRGLSSDYVQQFWKLDRDNNLLYINLLEKDEVVHLLWEAYIWKEDSSSVQ